MLVNFSTDNFLSFNEPATLSLTKGKTRIHGNNLLQEGNLKLLKFGALYGANASGKSNLIHAMAISRHIVIYGLNAAMVFDVFNKNSHKNENKDTSFEYEIALKKKIFSYGFSFNAKKAEITKEWLIDITNEENVIFTRSKKIHLNNEYLKLDENLLKRFEIYAEDAIYKKNILFLTYIKNIPIQKLSADFVFYRVFDWFNNKLEVISPSTTTKDFGIVYNNAQDLDKLSIYLQENDTGITKVCFEETNDIIRGATESEHHQVILKFQNDTIKHKRATTIAKFPGGIYKFVKDEKGIKIFEAKFYHGNTKFSFYEESDGTKRLMELFPIVSDVNKNKTFVIDEIDRSLHPLLTVNFVKKFLLNNNNNQLIITTHEDRLLDLGILRRDQFWFVEKNKEGNTSLYSLEEYKDRFDKNIMNAYLSGRYGATPDFSKSLTNEKFINSVN